MAPSTQEIPGIEMPEFNRLTAYWILSPSVWLSLATVWLVVAFSVVTSFEIPGSGAVLVGGALVSEMLFKMLFKMWVREDFSLILELIALWHVLFSGERDYP